MTPLSIVLTLIVLFVLVDLACYLLDIPRPFCGARSGGKPDGDSDGGPGGGGA